MFRQYRPIEPNEFFVIFADTSAGMGDRCAVQFLSKTRIDIPLVYHSPQIATEMTNTIHPVIERIYDITKIKPVVAYERNNGGVFELERLASMNRLGKYRIFQMPRVGNVDNGEAVKLGWDTNTASRPQMLQDFKNAVDNRLIAIYDKLTIDELYSFVKIQTSSTIKAQAEAGSHDDLVMSGAGVWQMFQMCEPEKSAASYEYLKQQLPQEDWKKRSWY